MPLMEICVWMGVFGVASSARGLPPALDVSLLESPEPACHSDLQALRRALQQDQLWALTMLDASVKWPSGLLSQTAIQFGDYDLCLTVVTPVTAQFCLPDISPVDSNSSWTGVKWGICVPASCSPQALQDSLQQLAGPELRVNLLPVTCTSSSNAHRPFDSFDIIFCTIMVGIVILVASATIYDTIVSPDYDGISQPQCVVECLSARRGFVRLFRADQPLHDINLQPLYGLHSCAFFFVVLGHRFCAHLMLMTLSNYRDIEYMYRNPWLAMWTGHVDLFVDMFFFMSAYLMSLIYYSELHKRHISPITVYFYRFWRLVPAYAVVVFVYATVLRHAAQGPLWNMVMDVEQGSCRSYWWANLLFINNIIAFDQMCMNQSWYLACEFQLFVVGVILVFFLHKSWKSGLLVAATVFVASTLAAFFGTYFFNRPAMIIFDKTINPRLTDMFTSIYSQSYYRGTSYLPGLLAGCITFRIKTNTIFQTATRSLQAASLMGCLLVFWSGALFSDTSQRPSVLINSLYAAVFHTLFGCSFGLLVVSSVIGKPTCLSRVMSWRGFVPLSKLSYCVFLTHFMLQIPWAAATRAPVHFNAVELLSWTIADCSISLVFALILFLAVESPVKYLIKYLISSKPKSSLSSMS